MTKRKLEIDEKEAKALDESLQDSYAYADFIARNGEALNPEAWVDRARDREDLQKKLRAVFPELKR